MISMTTGITTATVGLPVKQKINIRIYKKVFSWFIGARLKLVSYDTPLLGIFVSVLHEALNFQIADHRN